VTADRDDVADFNSIAERIASEVGDEAFDVASVRCASLVYQAVFGDVWRSIRELTQREFEQQSAARLVSRYRVMRSFHRASIRESAVASITDELRRVQVLFEATTTAGDSDGDK